jgi:general stress protein 26
MSTAGVDEDGTIWFLSDKESEKNRQLEKDNQVYLMYMDNSSNHYLSLSGQSSIVEDKVKLEALWTPIAKAWFEEGVDDPRISLIKVKPKTGHYWDTKNGKLVSMLKIAAAVVTGKEGMDDGIEGDLKIK